jgi:hypothetical protein
MSCGKVCEKVELKENANAMNKSNTRDEVEYRHHSAQDFYLRPNELLQLILIRFHSVRINLRTCPPTA